MYSENKKNPDRVNYFEKLAAFAGMSEYWQFMTKINF